MIWILTLWFLPMLFVWAVTIYEWKFTSMVYTRSTAVATGFGGVIPIVGLILSVMYIADKISYLFHMLFDKDEEG